MGSQNRQRTQPLRFYLVRGGEYVSCRYRGGVGLFHADSCGEEGKQVMSVLDVPEGYVMPCYIGIGYPAENAPVVAQVEKPVDSTLHFGKW